MATRPLLFRRPDWVLWFIGIFVLFMGGFFFVVGLRSETDGPVFILVGAILGLASVGLMLWARSWSRKHAEDERIRAHGVPGKATILSVRETSMYMEVGSKRMSRVELTLRVETEMHPPYDVVVKDWFQVSDLPQVASGPLPVKVDPANLNRVVIEWGSPLLPPSFPRGPGEGRGSNGK